MLRPGAHVLALYGGDFEGARAGAREVASAAQGMLFVHGDVRSAIAAASVALREARTARRDLRVAIHVGPASLTHELADGPAVDHIARVLHVAVPGQMLLTESCWTDLGGAALVLRDLGGVALAGFRGRCRLYQGLPRDLDFAPAPPRAAALPGRPAWGPERALAGMAELLGLGVRHLTLIGPPGSGRSALLSNLAHRLRSEAGDVVPVRCGDATAAALFRGVAVSMDLSLGRGAGRAAATEQLGFALAQRDRTTLLIDAVGPEVREELGEWLRAAPALRIVAVAPERLGLPGEVVWEVGPLPVRTSSGDSPAAEYLAERAASLGAPAVNQASLAALVDRVGGSPLALSLLASLLLVAAPDELLVRLGDSDVGEAGVLDEIFVRLPGPSRDALLRCAAVPCPLAPADLAAVVGADLPLLASFHGRGLLRSVFALDTAGLDRWALHPAVADLLRVRISADDRREVAAGLAERVLSDVARWEAWALGRHAPEVAARKVAQADALLALATGNDAPTAARAWLALQDVNSHYGLFEVERPRLDAAIENTQAGPDLDGLLLARATLWREANRPGEALADLERVRTGAMSRGDGAILGRCYLEAGRCLGSTGAAKASLDHFERAVAALLDASEVHDATRAEVALGAARVAASDVAGGEEALCRALSRARALEIRGAEAEALEHLGQIRRVQGRSGDARSCFREAARLAEEVGDRTLHAMSLSAGAAVDLSQGLVEEVIEPLELAVRLAGLGSARRCEAMSMSLLGRAHLTAGRRDEARRHLLQSLSLHRALRDPALEGYDMGYLGIAQHVSGNRTAARDYYSRAINLLENAGLAGPSALFSAWCGALEAQEGDLERARGLFERAAAHATAPADRLVGLLRFVAALAEAERDRGSVASVRGRLVPALVAVPRKSVDARLVAEFVQGQLEAAPLG